MINLEAEALINEAVVAIDLEDPMKTEVGDLVKKHKEKKLKYKTLEKLVIEIIEESGTTGGILTRKYYEDSYNSMRMNQ